MAHGLGLTSVLVLVTNLIQLS